MDERTVDEMQLPWEEGVNDTREFQATGNKKRMLT
jgi:hypothetical protein